MARYRKVRASSLPKVKKVYFATASQLKFDGNVNELLTRIEQARDYSTLDEKYSQFAGLKNVEQGNEFLVTGNPDVLEKYINTVGELNTVNVSNYNKDYYNDKEGLFIDTDAVVKGLPECWLNEAIEQPNKFIEVVVNVSFHYKVTETEIFKKYVHVFNLIDNLESNGYRTKISLEILAAPSKEMASLGGIKNEARCTIKEHSQPFNIQQMVTLICSPLFLRFAVLLMRSEYYKDYAGQFYSDVESENCGLINGTLYIPSMYYDDAKGLTNEYYKNLSIEETV